MDVKSRIYITLLLLLYSIGCVHGQKNKSFSGELIYHIENVEANQNELISDENEEERMIIYAKDSLLKIVNFNSVTGVQECLKHLTHNKSILLLEIDGQGYAVRIKSDEINRGDSLYTFKRKCGVSKEYKGLKSKKILMKHPMLSNDLICLYTKEIPTKYSDVFSKIPGLPILYYLVSENGLLRLELESYKEYDPPLSVFMIPEGYQILSMEEFLNGMKNSDN